MMNFIGKGLVLIHTLLSLAGLTLAIVIWFGFIDWGRAEPRGAGGDTSKGGGTRTASEFDKAVAAVKEGEQARNLAVPLMAPAEKSLEETAARFPANHLFYVAELKRLSDAPGDIEVLAIPADGVPTDTPGLPYGKPIPSIKVDGVTKSLEVLRTELKAEIAKLKPLEEDLRKWAEKDAHVSFLLTGKDADGKKQHGMYELVDEEFKQQQRLRGEREYLQPFWAAAKEESRRFANRREGLEATLLGLEKTLKQRGLK